MATRLSSALAPDFEFVNRHRLITTDDYWAEIDEYRRGGDQLLIAHLRVVRWSPSVCKRFRHEWECFRRCVTIPIFTLGIEDDDKFERFVRSFGYQPFQTVTCLNGAQRRLYIHQVAKDPT